MHHLAKTLRTDQTDVERLLWHRLRNRRLCGYKFRRQQIIDPYIADFVCLERRLIVEIDGSQHLDHVAYDSARTAFLRSQGFRVLRFWNNEVTNNMNEVLDCILAALRTSSLPLAPSPSTAPLTPGPSPARGEGSRCHAPFHPGCLR
jgi:very-short-patch-repair endonuclease